MLKFSISIYFLYTENMYLLENNKFNFSIIPIFINYLLLISYINVSQIFQKYNLNPKHFFHAILKKLHSLIGCQKR